jgi:hypothetical protein
VDKSPQNKTEALRKFIFGRVLFISFYPSSSKRNMACGLICLAKERNLKEIDAPNQAGWPV